ncbi:gluconate 2-dehydrogenase subunit 3 family protein [Bacillus sp. FJAT-49705]|uniref:Gluconate 2-dehydrogenase subunit 3 family protein n=1 Tax=Cytobacillus citreus TaxID=2833586 RepID=A0ABS5NYF2_9BACI|nr:gluconate 2-dehydrogenase subunit 3 family protein [Cytobacillus citreus]MBS4192398.1 gluconate 2-dehydrogenase subunit 3 family protein [Cytobacillus citreus]
MADDNKEKNITRRTFIKNTGLVAGGVVGGSLIGGLLTSQWQTRQPTENKKTTKSLQEARVFFSREEDFAVLEAATERIFPKDDNGPGAVELGVPYYIDKQLAGSWGTNAKEYMKDPFIQTQQVHEYQHKTTKQDKSGPNTSTKLPTPTPRYQSRLNRSEIFIEGLRKIDQVSQKKYNVPFPKAEVDQQNEVLKAFEKGEVDMKGVAAVTFFHLLVQTTLEGVYSDPVYGGNKNMMGWKMKEYPGPRMAYLNDIDKEDFILMEPEGLRDYQSHGS